MKGRFTIDSGLIDSVNEGSLRESEENLQKFLASLPISYQTEEVKSVGEVDFRVDSEETIVITKEDKRGLKVEIPDYHLIPIKPISWYESEDANIRFVEGFKDLVTVEFEGRHFSLHYNPKKR